MSFITSAVCSSGTRPEIRTRNASFSLSLFSFFLCFSRTACCKQADDAARSAVPVRQCKTFPVCICVCVFVCMCVCISIKRLKLSDSNSVP